MDVLLVPATKQSISWSTPSWSETAGARVWRPQSPPRTYLSKDFPTRAHWEFEDLGLFLSCFRLFGTKTTSILQTWALAGSLGP